MNNIQNEKFNPSANSEQGFRVWWDQENNIGRVKITGKIDEQTIKDLLNQVDKILEKKEGTKWIIEPGETKPSATVRKMISERFYNNPKITKHVVISSSSIIRVIIKFLISTSGNNNVKVCATEEEALAWLKDNTDNS